MERYKKANEGIHAPDELKKKAAEDPAASGRTPKAAWLGAAAAILVVALLVGVVPRLTGVGRTGAGAPEAAAGAPAPGENGSGGDPAPGGASVGEPAVGAPQAGAPGAAPGADGPSQGEAVPLAAAVYPEAVPYPDPGDSAAFEAWWEDVRGRQALAPEDDGMAPFCAAALPEFLGNSNGENRVFSPLNVYLALSMLAETAGGNSRLQLLNLLNADSVEALRQRASDLWQANYRDDGAVTSLLAASLWLNDDLAGAYRQDTLDALARDYYASAFSGEMGGEDYNAALRGWIDDQTGGLLKDASGRLELDPETVLALVTTIHFQARWQDKFQAEADTEDVFHAPEGDETAVFLHESTIDSYYRGDGFGAVRKYLTEAGAMWFLLPDEGVSVDELLTSGAAAEFLAADKEDWPEQEPLRINLSVPKFDVSSDMSLTDGLKHLGVTDVFDPQAADLSALADMTGLFVSQAEHAARVTLDEEGVEAAAFTFVMVDAMGGPPEPEGVIDFTLDRPFLFAIESATGQLLFVGVVNHP